MDDILIIDDNRDILKQLKWGLCDEYNVHVADNCMEGIDCCNRHTPKLVILDLGLPPHENSTEEGFRCLGEILRARPMTKVIIVTGQGERENALKAIQMGAYDFFQKPIDLKELKIIIQRAVHLAAIEEENSRLHDTLQSGFAKMSGIIGNSPAMMKVLETAEKVAPADIPVLITGASGTGKELVARVLHSMSLRKDGPFIPINCGAIPENLLESELFGYEKGAFTGAHVQTQGKVEYAHNGTLFLDEIGELPLALQVKLLRFLQEKTIQRIGGRKDIAADARIIAASNSDIHKAMKEGTFRDDLYYRIGGVSLQLPLLKDRGEDIVMIANYFLRRYSSSFSKKVKDFSAVSLDYMRSYEWPGNIRELENRVQGAVIMADSAFIEPHNLGFSEKKQELPNVVSPSVTKLKQAKEMVEKEMLCAAMERDNGNMTKIAEELGVSRPTLYGLLKKYGLGEK